MLLAQGRAAVFDHVPGRRYCDWWRLEIVDPPGSCKRFNLLLL